MEKIKSVAAVREYFATPERPVTFAELKELGGASLKELAPLCAQALGKELETTV